jgi:hypothetical protein
MHGQISAFTWIGLISNRGKSQLSKSVQIQATLFLSLLVFSATVLPDRNLFQQVDLDFFKKYITELKNGA